MQTRKINDAVVVLYDGDVLVRRVIAFTDNGHAVVSVAALPFSIIIAEEIPGELQRVGRFVRSPWLLWLGRRFRWDRGRSVHGAVIDPNGDRMEGEK